MRNLALLGSLAIIYVLAAWSTRPGFYEGGFNPNTYNWISPPSQFRATNQPAQGGSGSFRLGRNGLVDPGTAYTTDGQASLSFVPGSFAPPAGVGSVTVTLTPVKEPPDPGSLHLAANVYLVSASQPLVRDALITLTYSSSIPAPDRIYYRGELDGSWRAIPTTANPAIYSVSARTDQLGYFAAAYSPNAFSRPKGALIAGGQVLPITVAVLVLVVILAGVPLAFRRGTGQRIPTDESELTRGDG